MKDLFSELTADSTPVSRRKDLILFLKELCAFAQNLQPQAREIFYKVCFLTFCILTHQSFVDIVSASLDGT